LTIVYVGVSEPNLGSAVGFSMWDTWKMATLKRGSCGSKRAGRPLLRLPASCPQRSSLNLANGKPADLDNVTATFVFNPKEKRPAAVLGVTTD